MVKIVIVFGVFISMVNAFHLNEILKETNDNPDISLPITNHNNGTENHIIQTVENIVNSFIRKNETAPAVRLEDENLREIIQTTLRKILKYFHDIINDSHPRHKRMSENVQQSYQYQERKPHNPNQNPTKTLQRSNELNPLEFNQKTTNFPSPSPPSNKPIDCVSKTEMNLHKTKEETNLKNLQDELGKLKGLVQVLRDEQYILNMLRDISTENSQINSNLQSANFPNSTDLIKLRQILSNPNNTLNSTQLQNYKEMLVNFKENVPVTNSNALVESNEDFKSEMRKQSEEIEGLRKLVEEIWKHQSESVVLPIHLKSQTRSADEIEQNDSMTSLLRRVQELRERLNTIGSDDMVGKPLKPIKLPKFEIKSGKTSSRVRASTEEDLQKLLNSLDSKPQTRQDDLEDRLLDLERQLKLNQKRKKKTQKEVIESEIDDLERELKQMNKPIESKSLDEDNEEMRIRIRQLQRQLKKVNHVESKSGDLENELIDLQAAISRLRPKDDTNVQTKEGEEFQSMLANLLSQDQSPPSIQNHRRPTLNPNRAQLIAQMMQALNSGGFAGNKDFGGYAGGGGAYPANYFGGYANNKDFGGYAGYPETYSTPAGYQSKPYPYYNTYETGAQYGDAYNQPYAYRYPPPAPVYTPPAVNYGETPSYPPQDQSKAYKPYGNQQTYSQPPRNFFPAPQRDYEIKSSPGEPYKPPDNPTGDNRAQTYQNPSGGSTISPTYSQQRVKDLEGQIYNLQGVINTLNRPEYVQKPEDKQTIQQLDQQINDLKAVVGGLTTGYEQSQTGQEQSYTRSKRDVDGNAWSQLSSFVKDIFSGSTNDEEKVEANSHLRTAHAELYNRLENLKKQLESKTGRSSKQSYPEYDNNYSYQQNYPVSYYIPHTKTKVKTFVDEKKFEIWEKIVTKVTNKLVQALWISLPIIAKSIFGVGIQGLKQGAYYQGQGYGTQGYDYGLEEEFKSFGLIGYIPLIALKLLQRMSRFIYYLQKNKFVKFFLVPGLVTALSAGLVVFLTWWLTNDTNQYPQITNSQYNYGGDSNYATYTNYEDNYYRANQNNRQTTDNYYSYRNPGGGYYPYRYNNYNSRITQSYNYR